MSANLHPLIAVVGPTASGKTALALALAERFAAEIVNCDAVQIYRGFDIGSAKLPAAERRGIPHHLLDAIDPQAVFTAGDYAREARAVLERLRKAGKVAVLAGGAGLYFSALARGLFAGPTRDVALRKRLERTAAAKPAGYLNRLLARLDPEAAARIHPNDTPKLIRAVEVSLRAGRPMSEQWRKGGEALAGYNLLLLGLSPARESLYARIDARAAAMFEQGLIDEVEGLLASGVGRGARAFGSLGYAQCLDCLDGKLSLSEAVEAAARATRRYAKRQLTWFRRREPETHWFEGFGDTPEAEAWAFEKVQSCLGRR